MTSKAIHLHWVSVSVITAEEANYTTLKIVVVGYEVIKSRLPAFRFAGLHVVVVQVPQSSQFIAKKTPKRRG